MDDFARQIEHLYISWQAQKYCFSLLEIERKWVK